MSAAVGAGTERWTVGLPHSAEAKAMLDDLAQLGAVKVVSLAQETFPGQERTEAKTILGSDRLL